MKRVLLPLLVVAVAATMFAINVQADSIITIPVPDKAAKDKQVTLTLRIPPNTEPVTQKPMPKLTSRSSLIVWHSNPSPKIDANDEVYSIIDRLNAKGFLKGMGPRALVARRPLDRYYVVRILEEIINNILNLARSPNIVRKMRTINLESTDIEDLRRMLARFQKDFILFGGNPKKIDRDLLMFQEKLKEVKSGTLKVIKVENAGDGSTIIHLNVD